MKIISFNVNGIRARLHQLSAVVAKHSPDVIGLQEVKVQNDLFPYEDVEKLGYKAHVHGQKGHYGVALLTKIDATDIQFGFPGDAEDAQRRMIGFSVNYQGSPLHIYNGYFPQGESRDHPQKFPNKRKFYADLSAHLETQHQPSDQIVIMGDMNISPTDRDIGIGEPNMKRWLRTGKCSFLPEEREWYQRLYDWGLTDAWRALNPDEEKTYSCLITAARGLTTTPNVAYALITT